jgi:dihydrofolate reductase
MTVSIIVAASLNHAIGKDNQLLWHLPADLKFFKTTTMGCPVVMGRKTFQSIGRTLPGRKNVVITRDKNFNSDNQFDILVVGSVDEALVKLHSEKEVFIIGGGEIYKQVLEAGCVKTLYLSLIDERYNADTYFPEIDRNIFRVESEVSHPSENDSPAWRYQVLQKND